MCAAYAVDSDEFDGATSITVTSVACGIERTGRPLQWTPVSSAHVRADHSSRLNSAQDAVHSPWIVTCALRSMC